jgi:hypothetical protein
MPTIELARLQQEAAQLSDYFNDPPVYLRGVERLLQTYAVPVHRQGRVKGLRPILRTYEVPPPLVKQLHLEMSQQAKLSPQQALQIADGLWQQRTIETRTLAPRLLGAIEEIEPAAVAERMEAWTLENREPTLLPELRHGVFGLAKQAPEKLLGFAKGWLDSGEPRRQVLALGVVQTLLTTTGYANLPVVFALLADVSRNPDRKLRPDLVELLTILAERSPHETEYFLARALGSEPSEGASWVARQVSKSLPEESRERLRSLFKS